MQIADSESANCLNICSPFLNMAIYKWVEICTLDVLVSKYVKETERTGSIFLRVTKKIKSK